MFPSPLVYFVRSFAMTIEYKLTYAEARQSIQINRRHAFRTNPVFFYLVYGGCGLVIAGAAVYDFATNYNTWRSLGITPGPAQYADVVIVLLPAIFIGLIGLFSLFFLPASLASVTHRMEIDSSGLVFSSRPDPVK